MSIHIWQFQEAELQLAMCYLIEVHKLDTEEIVSVCPQFLFTELQIAFR